MKKIFVWILIFCFCLGGCVKTEPQIDPNLVTLEIISSTNKNVTFEIKNNSKDGISFGEDYYIEYMENGKWVPLEERGEYFFTMIAYGLGSGETKRFTVDFEGRYGALSDGTYRVTKDVRFLNEEGIDYGGQRIFAEFEVVAIER